MTLHNVAFSQNQRRREEEALKEYIKDETECDFCDYKFNKFVLKKCPSCHRDVNTN